MAVIEELPQEPPTISTTATTTKEHLKRSNDDNKAAHPVVNTSNNIDATPSEKASSATPSEPSTTPTPTQSNITEEPPLSSPTVVIVDQDLFYDAAEDQAHLLAKATEYKNQGNRYFGVADYDKALTSYQDAATLCPSDEHKQRAVYAANMAACYLKLNQAKEAKTQCDIALDLDPLYIKAKLRRAQANERLSSPPSSSALSDALKDYQDLLDQHNGIKKEQHKKEEDGKENDNRTTTTTITVPRVPLDKATLLTCQRAVRDLPPRIKMQMEKEKEEMMGKLKELGNTVLGKFGLSTDNFQFQQDPTSGNYSMNFVN
ncbi:hypothetical protein BCR42DRAFT_358269 [Absidia repens]|uniref:Uncharacterized protein n=1 Tax=Absidia repens TaxID=90262 RepID=A0A1X2I644_9FUNG|nr:hypothetical protein BCR42DRAFT_358269 [Absidia repens]